MEAIHTLIDKEVVIFTRAKLKFRATIKNTYEDFIRIIDHKDMRIKLINREEISTIEEQEDGTNYSRPST